MEWVAILLLLAIAALLWHQIGVIVQINRSHGALLAMIRDYFSQTNENIKRLEIEIGRSNEELTDFSKH